MTRRKPFRVATYLMAASALAVPAVAFAQSAASSREAQLEERLQRLEAEMQALRGDLAAARASQAETAAAVQQTQASTAATAEKLAAVEAKPQPEGFRVGSTTVKLGGFIKLTATNSRFSEGEVASNSFGRDFYLPQAIPVGTGPAARTQDISAKQSRFWMNLATDVAGHTLKGYLETDFQTAPGTQGSQRTTNGYNLALRRAYIQVDKWTFGQDWSTFQYTGALPESTDFVGGAEGTVFVRQALVRYSMPLSKKATLHLSLENPEAGTVNAGSTTMIENGDDSVPDFTARLALAPSFGELSLAGLVRNVRVQNAGVSENAMGWGVSGAGKVFLNSAKSSDFRFMATYGHNAGRYIGLNFAPDAVLKAGNLESVKEFAALGAFRVALTPKVRVNLMGSYQSVDYSSALTLADVGGLNDSAWSVAGNVFFSPIKSVDVGVEYRHGTRELVNGLDGNLSRLEFAAKYSF